jgi:hypothetical protein
MDSIHLSAVALTLALYSFLAVSYFGWGKAAHFILGIGKSDNRTHTLSIWMGWAFTLFIFQLIHFVLPLTAFTVLPVFMVGVALSVPEIVAACRRCTNTQNYTLLRLVIWTLFVVVILVVSCWIASRSMLHPKNWDSGLYHFNKIRWINSYPVVPGLGNLHGRLAFNQSFFAYVAALNFYPFFGHGYAIANSFLLLLTIATFIDSLRPVFSKPFLFLESHPFEYVTIVMLFPTLGYLALFSDGLFSPSPDLPSTLLQLTMIMVFAQGIGEWRRGAAKQNYRVQFLAVLAVTAVTIKLSNLAFSLVIMSFSLLYAAKLHAISVVIRITVVSVVIGLVWCLHSIVLSGAPLYPSTIGYLPVEWSVPLESIENEAKAIYSWGRQPFTHYNKVLGNWDWFGPWLVRLSRDMVNVVYPLATALFFFIITVIISLTNHLRNGNRPQYMEWTILLPSVIGLTYWFFTAPDPRFANALFFIISMCSALLFLVSIQKRLTTQLYGIAVVAVVIVFNFQLAAVCAKNIGIIKWVSVSGWHPLKSAPLVTKVTLSGLSVYTLKEKPLQCWDSPLPSTPYFNPRLKLRNPENMSAGFMLSGEKE